MITQEAGSKFLGFLYQIERALYRIFSSEHDSVVFGIETADDVVEEICFANGELQIAFEQDKHSLDISGQPYQDSSKNLWHTLHIWLSKLEYSKVKYDKITYCLVTNKEVGQNTLARTLSEAITNDQVTSALIELKKQGKAITGAVKITAEKVLDFPEDQLKFLIENVLLLDKHGTVSGLNTKHATINLLHIPTDIKEHSESIYQSLLGFLVDKCQLAWKNKIPLEISKESFSNLLFSECNKIKRKKFTEQPRLRTEYKKYLQEDNTSHVFIEQLQYIGKDIEACNRALENYWAFYSERVRLQDSGEIPFSAWEERNDEIYNRWLDISTNLPTAENNHDGKMIRFEKIYSDTLDNNYRASLNGSFTTHSYFTHGNYHALANNQDKDYYIYWHDDYKTKGNN